MKNLLITFCLALFTTISFSQTSLSIVGLDTKDSKKEVTFSIKTAESTSQKIIISRAYDAKTSGLIKDACKTKRVFVSSVIKLNSKGFVINLTTITIKNYSWKIDEKGRVTEYFEIYYNKIN